MTITNDNYEWWFYRYAEGELDAGQRAEVEAFAAQHPALAEELALYDPTLKLEAAPAVYADKESLRRRQPQPLALWRWAAAAMVAAAVVAGVWMIDGGTPAESPMVAQVAVPQPAPQQQRATDETRSTIPADTPTTQATPAPAARSHKAMPSPSTPKVKPLAEPTTPQPAAEPEVAEAIAPTATAMQATEPVVIIHHEEYVVASSEPETVEEGAPVAGTESSLENLRGYGRSVLARLRAQALRTQGNARMVLASL